MPSILPTSWDQDWNKEQEVSTSGHTMHIGFYIDYVSLTFKVCLASFSSIFSISQSFVLGLRTEQRKRRLLRPKKIEVHTLGDLTSPGFFFRIGRVGRQMVSLFFGNQSSSFISYGAVQLCSQRTERRRDNGIFKSRYDKIFVLFKKLLR